MAVLSSKLAKTALKLPWSTAVLDLERNALKPEPEHPSLSLHLFMEMEPLEAEWRALEAAQECSIHQSYDWCRLWQSCSDYAPRIVVARFSTGLARPDTAFILPLTIERQGPVKVARYIGGRFNRINFGAFATRFLDLVSPALMIDIQRQIAALPLGADIVLLDRQPQRWHGITHPLSRLPHLRNRGHGFQIALQGGPEAVIERIATAARWDGLDTEALRLDRPGNGTYLRAKTREEAQALLETFFRQASVRSNLYGTANRFASGETQAALHRLAEDSIGKHRKTIEMHAIRLSDGSIGALLALSRKGRHVTWQFSSVDGETLLSGPGLTLMAHAIRSACDTGATVFDFGAGHQPFRQSWCDMETAYQDTVIPITALGRMAAATIRMPIGGKRPFGVRPTPVPPAVTGRQVPGLIRHGDPDRVARFRRRDS